MRAAGLFPTYSAAAKCFALVKAGAIDGLSIGFKTVRGRVDPRTRIRKIEQVDLWEISIVTFPLLTGARVRAVKDAGTAAHDASDRHERLFRRHPRFSFARTCAEAEWKAIFRDAAESENAARTSCVASPGSGSATRLDLVQQRRQAPAARRERRIRGWIAPSALQAMADRKALPARPSR